MSTAAPPHGPAPGAPASRGAPAVLGRVPIPTRRLALIAVLASLIVLIAPVPAPWGLLVVDLLVLAAFAVDATRATDPRTIAVSRQVPGVIPLGRTVELVWRVRNPGRRPLRVRIADELAPSLRPASRRAELELPPGATGTARTTLTPRRRGRFEPRQVAVRTHGPLGLAARQDVVAVPGTLRVYPSFRSREEVELRLERARLLEVGLRSARGRGGGTEFDRLREYGVDDEFRRIDWAATARTGRAIVREYRAERNQTVLVLLDVGRVMAGRLDHPTPGRGVGDGVPRLDHAMDAVMALTTVATRLGDRIGMVAFGSQVHAVVAPGHTADQLPRITEAMYRLEPELAESDYRGAFATTLARFRRRTLLVLLTELAEEAMVETLLPALPLITRDHLVIVGAVRDPHVAAWAAGVPAAAGGAYRKAAAVERLEARRRMVTRLHASGVTVVDGPPGTLAPQLVDVYLRIKAAGRL